MTPAALPPAPPSDGAPSERSRHATGFLLVFLSAVCFSAKAIFVKLGYAHGGGALTLLGLRMGFALPFFAVLSAREIIRDARRSDRAPLRPRDWAIIAFQGLSGFYLSSLFDFLGLLTVPASLERLILFLYPTFVVLLAALFFRRRPGKNSWIALVLCYAGMALALGGERGILRPEMLLGAGLILVSTLTYAIYLVVNERVLPRIGATRLTAHVMTISCLAVLVHAGLAGALSPARIAAPILLYGAATALVSTVAPTLLLNHGIERIGASRAAIAGSVGPVSTIVLAAFFLGERIGALQVAGGALVIAGVLAIQRR